MLYFGNYLSKELGMFYSRSPEVEIPSPLSSLKTIPLALDRR